MSFIYATQHNSSPPISHERAPPSTRGWPAMLIIGHGLTGISSAVARSLSLNYVRPSPCENLPATRRSDLVLAAGHR